MNSRRHNGHGRMYWSDSQVRVWTNDGRFLDLGKHSLESTRKVADEFGYVLIVQRGHASNLWLEHSKR